MPKSIYILTRSLFVFIFFSLFLSTNSTTSAENIFILPCEYYGQEEEADSLIAGQQISAYDPDGVLIGQYTISQAGRYGFMSTSGDDPATPQDEGAVDGDIITFYINGVQQQQQALWKSGDIAEVTLGIPQDTGYYNLHLDDMPAYLSYNNDPRFSGPAVDDMILDFLDPDNTDTQQDILSYGDTTIVNNTLELSEMARTLNAKAPSIYNFTSTETLKSYSNSGLIEQFDPTNQNDVMKQLCHWIAYQVPSAEEGKKYVPVAAATSADPALSEESDYEHWMSVVGIRTNEDPFPSLNASHVFSDYYNTRDDLQIYGVYLNDPAQSGLGFHFYMSADVWTNQYFRPIAPELEAEGTYVALMEPSKLNEKNIQIVPSQDNKVINKTLLVPQAGVSFYLPGWTNSNALHYLKEITTQLRSSEDFQQLFKDEYFKEALIGTQVKRCYKVDGMAHDDYTIIPFEKSRDGKQVTTSAMIFNNATGQFMTAFADPDADQMYYPMPWWKAYYAFRKVTNWRREYPVNYWQSNKTGSPLFPGWSMVTIAYDQIKSGSYMVLTSNRYSITPDETVEVEDTSSAIQVVYDLNYRFRGQSFKIFVFDVTSDEKYSVELINQKNYSYAYTAHYQNRWVVVLSDNRRLSASIKIQNASSDGSIQEGGITYVRLY